MVDGLFPTTRTFAVSHSHATDTQNHVVSDHTLTHDLGRPAVVTVALTAVMGEAADVRFAGVYVVRNDDTTLTVRVVSTTLAHVGDTTLTATLEVSYW